MTTVTPTPVPPATAVPHADDLMRHMFLGRLVSQHTMIFEPLVYAEHLRVLTRLVDTYVLTPTGAGQLATYSPANVATVRLAAAVGVIDGGWPAFASSLRTEELSVGGRPHQIVVDASNADKLPLLRAATEVLVQGDLGALVELGTGGLAPAKALSESTSIGARLLVAPDWTFGPDASALESLLYQMLAAPAQIWAAVEPSVYQSLRRALGPIRVEDVFVAGCVAQLLVRAEERGEGLAARIPALVALVETVSSLQTAAARTAAQGLKEASLFAELLCCWWPGTERAVHLFTSRLDYLTRHPVTQQPQERWS
ncbi:hypothetical protein AB0B83_20145 [Micromonospora sp. NPDC049060]|uniref:hypothetical protein n=1 Tax=unclassified Micromonospora TaxID=2617518 RepID=UPI0033E30932